MRKLLEYLYSGGILSCCQAKDTLIQLTKGDFPTEQIVAFLTVFQVRGLQVEELKGFQKGMSSICKKIVLKEDNIVDMCGTGGDGKDTFNISTVASFVAAGAGVKIAKHGNQGVSSSVGSSNILSHFGYRFEEDNPTIQRAIEEIGIVFLHAPLFFPTLKHIAPIRKALATKTIFNILGPIVNPTAPKKQVIGVCDPYIASLYKSLFEETDKEFAIVYSKDGYDEISLTDTCVIEKKTGKKEYSPESLGFHPWEPKDIECSSLQKKADTFINILQDKSSKAEKEVTLANAAMAIQLYFNCNWEESIQKAKTSIENGNAFEKFEKCMKWK